VSKVVTCTAPFGLSSSLKLIHVITNAPSFGMTPFDMLGTQVSNVGYLWCLLN
jgi:hypothetical protein